MARGQTKRGGNGQFQKGHGGGPGRPKGLPKEREYLEAFRSRVSIQEWTEAVGQQLAKALKGDSKAFEMLAKYCLPEPAQIHKWSEKDRELLRFAGMQDKDMASHMAARVIETFRQRSEPSIN